MPIVLTAFLARVKPVSTIANPTCMNMTRKPAMSTHARLSDCSMSSPPGRGGRPPRRWTPAAEPDEGREACQDGDDQERHGEPAGNAAQFPPSTGASEAIAGRHRRRVAQIVEEFGRGLVAIAGVALDGLEQDGLEGWVEAGDEVAGRFRFAIGLGAHHGKCVRPGERQMACEHLIEDGTERVDVGARVAAPPADLLRRDVVGLTDGGRETVPGVSSSRLKRSKKTTSLSNCKCGTLSATVMPVAVSFASKMDAIPLRAMSLVISYWSSLSPTATSRIGRREGRRTRGKDYGTRAQPRQSSRRDGNGGRARVRIRDGRPLRRGDRPRPQRGLLRRAGRERDPWSGRRGRRRLRLRGWRRGEPAGRAGDPERPRREASR